MLKKLFVKYKDIISYLFFGVCTTVVNIVAYWFCAHAAHLSTIVSTSIAWVLAVAFAYITNRLWVFHSKAKGRKEIFREICSFTACRLFTGFLDIAIMYIFVDKLHCDDVVIKIISNIIVIIVNYIASKLVIFNQKNNESFVKKCLIVVALFLISFSLAQLSEWGVWKHRDGYIDANVYKYVGQVIRDGGMPYRDVFDHKGPLMYLLQAAGGYINEYHGEWIFEFGAIFVTACAFYLIARLLKCKPWQALLATIVPLTLLKTTYGGTYGAGACCCLFAMPFVSVSFYIFLKYFLTGRVKNLSVWLCGLCCGSVLMLRPNIVAVWAVFGIIILIKTIREKQFNDLLRFFVLFLLGVATIVAPIMIWLAANGAFADFVEQFIEFNLFYSSNSVSMAGRLDAVFYIIAIPIIAFAIIYSIYRLIVYREKLDIYSAIFLSVNIALAAMSGRAWAHYVNMLFPSLIYPYARLFAQLPCRVKKGKKLVLPQEKAPVLLCVAAILAITIVPVWGEILRSDAQSFMYRNSGANGNEASTLELAAVVQKYTDENDKIQAFGHMPTIYNVAHRRSASRFMYYLTFTIELFKDYHEEYYGTLEKEKPKIMLVSSGDYWAVEEMRNFLKRNDYSLVFPESKNGGLDEEERLDTTATFVFYRSADEK